MAGFRKRSGATIAGYWKASSPKSSEHPVPLIWATVDRNQWLELATQGIEWHSFEFRSAKCMVLEAPR